MGRIDRIILDNFKSYAGNHTLGPFKTFTAIIGPNGSGKSNVLDAISFVLGVKSAQLRGTALTDLIHRTPAEQSAAAGTVPGRNAAVELIYIDSEDNEISFKRTINARSGASVYSCRGRVLSWDQYNSELESINIIVKAKNFLVFQGDVETIASKSPREYTELFEVISGSGSLKKSYIEAQQRLESAEEEFIRIFERKRNILKEKRNLKEQTEEANRYKQLLSELNELKLLYYLFQLYHLDSERTKKYSELKEIQSVIVEKSELMAEKETIVKDQSILTASKRREIAVAESLLSKQNKLLEKLRPNIIQLHTEIIHLEKSINSLESKQKEAESKAVKQSKEIEKLTSEIKSVEELKSKLESDIAANTAAAAELSLAVAELKEYEQLKERAGKETAELQQKLNVAQLAYKRENDLLESILAQIENLKQQQKVKQQSIEELTEREIKLKEQVKETKSLIDTESAALTDLKKRNIAAAQQKKQLTIELQRVTTELMELDAVERQSAADLKLNDALESLINHFPGVYGRITKLCRPISSKYNIAITIALGKHTEAVVVDSTITAMNCIEYLREQRLGSFTFIPLDSIKVQPISESYRTLGGSIQLALDVLQFEETVQKAIQYVVGNTLICDSLSEAKKLAYSPSSAVMGGPNRYKIVTLDGSVVHKSGNLEGGSTRFSKTDKFKDADINKARARKDQLTRELIELEQLDKAKDSELAAESKLKNLKTRLQYQEADLKSIQDKLKKDREVLKSIKDELSIKEPEAAKLESSVNKLLSTVTDIEKQISTIEDRIFAPFSRKVGVRNIREYEENRLVIAQQHIEQRAALDNQLSKLKEQLAYEQSRDMTAAVNEIKSKLTAARKKLTNLQASERESTANLDNEKNKLNSILDQLNRLNSELDSAQLELKSAKSELQKLMTEIESLDKAAAILSSQIEQAKDLKQEIIRRCALEQIELPILKAGAKRGRGKGTAAKSKRRRGAASDEEESEASADADGDEAAAEDEEADNLPTVPGEPLIDYSALSDEATSAITPSARDKQKHQYIERISELTIESERLAPNLKAYEKYDEVKARLDDTNSDWESKKESQQLAAAEFDKIKNDRLELFMRCYNHISKSIESIYSALTRSADFPTGGKAYLTLESSDSPFDYGIKYTAMPPMKRFRAMEQLSGGERTVAALALLFSIHSYHPAPFFVLDEIDAALDNINVTRVSNYIRTRAHTDKLQCIVISLKDTFYTKADALVGVYRDQSTAASGILTIDLTKFDQA